MAFFLPYLEIKQAFEKGKPRVTWGRKATGPLSSTDSRVAEKVIISPANFLWERCALLRPSPHPWTVDFFGAGRAAEKGS